MKVGDKVTFKIGGYEWSNDIEPGMCRILSVTNGEKTVTNTCCGSQNENKVPGVASKLSIALHDSGLSFAARGVYAAILEMDTEAPTHYVATEDVLSLTDDSCETLDCLRELEAGGYIQNFISVCVKHHE